MIRKTLCALALLTLATGCGTKKGYEPDTYNLKPGNQLEGQAEWYRGTVFYHVWVKAFADSEYNDGIGDLQGIIDNMDYFEKLGVGALWLSPIFDCQKKNGNIHGYDVLDFYSLNDRFGTRKDLEELLEEAHDRGIRVIFDFMPNHTSSKHKWVKERPEWYVYSDTAAEGWGLPWGGGNPNNVWRFRNGRYMYSAFATDELLDLNYDYQDAAGTYPVKEEMLAVAKYWLDRGFDGIRVDAVRYIYENGGGKQADQPESFEFFKELRKLTDSYKDSPKVLLAEAWNDEVTIKSYYGNGTDSFHMCLDFPFAQRIDASIEAEDPSIMTALWQYEHENYPAGYQSMLFQSNHDNLRSRPATLFEGDKSKMLASAAMTLFGPGTPLLYYGNELGMEGEMGNDANLRTSINWEDAKKQMKDKNSYFTLHAELIGIYNTYTAMKGSTTALDAGSTVMGILKTSGDERIGVFMNLSTETADATVELATHGVPAGAKVKAVYGDLKGADTLNGTALTLKEMAPYSVRIVYLTGKHAPKKSVRK